MIDWEDLTLLEDLLASGLDDWVYASDVYGIAARSGLASGTDLRALALGLIAECLTDDLYVPGWVRAGEHQPWNCTTSEAIARIATSWREWGEEELTPGAIVWLELTETGRARAEEILGRE